jgi:hypothetical protein
MDVRNEFEKILLQYGYPVLVVRANTQIRCSCWNEKHQEADRECPICFGLGFVPVVEKWTTRDSDTAVPQTLPMISVDGKFGGMAVAGRQYYFKHNFPGKVQDLIVDVEWSNTGKPIYNGGGVYEIAHVDPQRFERGQMIFQKVYVKDQPVQKEIRGIRIANVNGVVNYEIAEQR